MRRAWLWVFAVACLLVLAPAAVVATYYDCINEYDVTFSGSECFEVCQIYTDAGVHLGHYRIRCAV